MVEERIGSLLTILVSPWPLEDRIGRLRFELDAVVELAADLDDLQSALSRRRVPPQLRGAQAAAMRTREVQLGDVFAAQVKHAAIAAATASDDVPRVAKWLRVPVFDITADAREAARNAFQLAVTAPLPAKVERALRRSISPKTNRGSP